MGSKLMRFLLLVLLFSCETPGGVIPGDVQFKREMKFKVNGVKGTGVMVAARADRYKIVISMDKKPEIIKLTTCHREYTIERGRWSGRKSHVFDFTANVDIENVGYCPIFIGAFDMQGQHSWGMIEINNEHTPATVQCNGTKKRYKGVSICQSRDGLQQRISFDQIMQVQSTGGCGDAISEDSRIFDFYMQKGICNFVFFNRNTNSYHRLTTVGYSDVMLEKIDLENHFPMED